MAPENAITGVGLLFKADDILVGGQESAQLSYTAGLIELLTKNAGFWGKTLNGEAEWNVTANNVHTEDDGTHKVGADGTVSLAITYNSTTETVPGLNELTATLSSELSPRGGLGDPLWRMLRVTGLGLQIETSGDWYDPNSTAGAAYGLILDAQEAGDTVDFELTFGALTFSGSLRPGDWTLDTAQRGDNASIDFSFQHDDEITRTGTIDAGLEALLMKWFDRGTVSALIEYQEDGSKVDGATEFTGAAFVETLTLSASRAEELRIEAALAGDGALTRQTYSEPA